MDPSSSSFYHPFQPYEIQLQFMNALYSCIENGKIGIFESPTGTGKSLSLVCGSMTWLRDSQAYTIEKELSKIGTADEPEWLVQAAREDKRRSLLYRKKLLEERLSAARSREARNARKLTNTYQPSKKVKVEGKSSSAFEDGSIEQYALDDYDSGEDTHNTQRDSATGSELSATTQALLGKLQPKQQTQDLEPDRSTKIFYCSRTHSQLSQLVGELRKVKLPGPSLEHDRYQAESGNGGQSDVSGQIKHLSLGSRRHLCINSKVSGLGSNSAINEKCLDLQKPETPNDKRCPFLPSENNSQIKEYFQDRALANIRDIEDLGRLGKEMGICPYYGSRSAADFSEIVTLPYPLLLQKSAREALGLSLEGHVVIVDEAHNLMDAITGVHSVIISLSQIEAATAHLTSYAQAFKNRLKGSNRMYIAQTMRLLRSVSECLRERTSGKSEGILPPTQLLAGKSVDQVNPHDLIRYLHGSKLLRKVEGFVEHQLRKNGENRQQSSQISNDLILAESLIIALVNPASEGRFFFSAQGSDLVLRYTLLDPANAFREIIEQARSVILAGGTMSPMSDYKNFLFPYLPQEVIQTISFGHVVPPSNVLVQVLSKGVGNMAFDFTFESRKSESMISELGNTLIRLSQSIPDGVVVFFPSYDYMSFVVEKWRALIGDDPCILDRLKAVKPLFLESKSSNSSEDLLQAYSISIDNHEGGLLFSVVGGKLSEGINFSDRLGRAVIMIGLPFPNIHTAEWKAKLEYLEESQLSQLKKDPTTGSIISDHAARAKAKAAGREFYENVCMRAVNQCIGRAIRHRNDYAAIYLLDKRYESAKMQKKLPGWIQESICVPKTFAEVVVDAEHFFANKP